MYINSTGTTKDGKKLGYDTEAFAIYDTMQCVFTPPPPCPLRCSPVCRRSLLPFADSPPLPP